MLPFRNPTEGFTLIEVLVALLILGIALTVLLSALLGNTSLNTKIDRKAEAVRISEGVLENYRQSGDYGTLRTDASQTVVRRGANYTIDTDFCPTGAPATMACTTTSVYIRVKVKYDGTTLQQADTYYTEFGRE